VIALLAVWAVLDTGMVGGYMDKTWDNFLESLHRTWIQLLLDNNYKDLASIAIDVHLTISRMRTEYDEWSYDRIDLEIPHEYHDFIVKSKSYKDIIENTLKEVAYDYLDRDPNNDIPIWIKRQLLPIEEDWRDKVREIIINSKASNQGAITEKLFARSRKQPIVYQEMKFGSQSEVRIAQELESRRVLFFPLPLAVRSDTGAAYKDHREPDFLICQDGVWGILEVSFHQPERYEKDSEKDIWFKQSGILCIQHYTAERCFNHPSEVVDEFLQLLAKHKR
jgi:hypothetical protein